MEARDEVHVSGQHPRSAVAVATVCVGRRRQQQAAAQGQAAMWQDAAILPRRVVRQECRARSQRHAGWHMSSCAPENDTMPTLSTPERSEAT